MIDSALTWTAVAAAAATLSALFAAIYVWLTYRLVRAQTEPHVVVYVQHDESRATLLMLVIENVGRGLATDVTFKTSRPVPAEAWGIEETPGKEAQPMKDGPLIIGIPTLGPGDSRKITWGQFGGLKNALGGEAIDVTCNFKSGRRKMSATKSKLEVGSFEGTDATSSEGSRLVKEVGVIGKQLEQLCRILERGREG